MTLSLWEDLELPRETCECCGAKIVKYRHRLNEPLIVALAKLRRAGGGPINLRHLGLTRNQWDNFQKLKYFGLVEQVSVDGQRKKGVWAITTFGRAFLSGQTTVRESAWTYRGTWVAWEGPLIRVGDVVGGYQHREEWAMEATPA